RRTGNGIALGSLEHAPRSAVFREGAVDRIPQEQTEGLAICTLHVGKWFTAHSGLHQRRATPNIDRQRQEGRRALRTHTRKKWRPRHGTEDATRGCRIRRE